MTLKAEIREYSTNHGFGGKPTDYQAIFVNDQKTNFWREKDPKKDGFFINTPLDELQAYCNMINQGIIKPSDKKELAHFDITSHLYWKPKKITISDYISGMALPSDKYQLMTVTGCETPDVKDMLRRGDQKHFTQYCKVIDLESKSIRQNMLIVIFPYGASFYSVK